MKICFPVQLTTSEHDWQPYPVEPSSALYVITMHTNMLSSNDIASHDIYPHAVPLQLATELLYYYYW